MSMISCSLFQLSRRSFSGPVAFIILLLSLTVCYAQGSSAVSSTGMIGNEEIQGRIFFPPGARSTGRPVIKLQSLSSPEMTGVTDRDGYFRFTHLRPDQYTVIVEAGDEYERASETVTIGNSGAVPAQGDPFSYAITLVYPVQIYLKLKGSNTITSQTSTSNMVTGNVPAPGLALFQQGLEHARAGNHLKAIEELKSSIAAAPQFVLAYNELAVQYLRIGQALEAVELLKEALRISPDDFTLRFNYGIALLNQKKFDAAETELRLALQKNKADSPATRYYLGLALINEQKFDEAQAMFESAIKNGGDKLVLAHKYLGGIYWRNKKYREAADELEKYVELEPKAPDAERIRGTIKELRHIG